METRQTLTPAERRLAELLLEHYDYEGEALYAVLLADLMTLCDKLDVNWAEVETRARNIRTSQAINENLLDGYSAFGEE